VDKPAAETPRSRDLTDEEMRKVWPGLAFSDLDALSVFAVQFQLITGQRSGEVVAAKWSEFDLDECIWTVPDHRTKNRTAHVVPLSHWQWIGWRRLGVCRGAQRFTLTATGVVRSIAI
jgi:integrase